MAAESIRVGLPGSDAPLVFWFDRLSLHEGRLHAAGWVAQRDPALVVESLTLRFGSERAVRLDSFGVQSPDLALHYGAHAANNRFDQTLELDPLSAAVCDPVLVVELRGLAPVEIPSLALQCASADPVHRLTLEFIELLRREQPGVALEIGSRNRVGASLKGQIPAGWSFVGMDILEGDGVDVVGDAHELSSLFPREKFDAVVSLAVFEHLLMPWKVAIELNRVLKKGAIGYVVAPQAWPAHEEPWDYFRYSEHAWAALFNEATGFQILGARHGEKASLVAQRVHGAVNFDPSATCYLASAVIFRKIADTELEWPVSLGRVIRTQYPA